MKKVMISIIATDIRGKFIPSNMVLSMLPDIEGYIRSISHKYSRIISGTMFDEYDVRGCFAKLLIVGEGKTKFEPTSKRGAHFETLEQAYDSNPSLLCFVSVCDVFIKSAKDLSDYVVVVRLNETYTAFDTHVTLNEESWNRISMYGRYSNNRDIGYHISVYRKSGVDDTLPADFWRAQSSAALSKTVKEQKEPKIIMASDKKEGKTKHERKVHATGIVTGTDEECHSTKTNSAQTVS